MNAAKVLIVGSGGQLGRELQETAPPAVKLIAADRAQLDITDAGHLTRYMRIERPDVVVNAAAYTAVDKAEAEPDIARRINVDGAANLAQACRQIDARLVHVSTDFVFDGAASAPYTSTAETNPLSTYGRTKRDGENAIMTHLSVERVLIVRTAWVYSMFGQNFVKTMLRLMREREEIRVVGDQVGTPTWARGFAQTIWRMLSLDLSGTHHWTDAGVASWYDFAVAIYEEARHLKILTRDVNIRQIRTVDYPTPARRPTYSVLDKTATWDALQAQPAHWRVSLRQMLQQLGIKHAA